MYTKSELKEHLNSPGCRIRCKSNFQSQKCYCNKIFVIKEEYDKHIAECNDYINYMAAISNISNLDINENLV